MKTRCRLIAAISTLFVPALAEAQKANTFSNFEIRVIRPKFFQKSVRLEAGATLGAVMNSTFTYTYLPGLKASLHLTELIELFGEGAAGITINKADCTELGGKFNIEPIVDETEMLAGGGAAFTPIYGKYQRASGDVLYFDWFFSGGGGIANMKRRKQGCRTLLPNEQVSPPKPYTASQFNFGTGQRYFVSKNLSLNWGFRLFFITGFENSGISQSAVLTVGTGYFF